MTQVATPTGPNASRFDALDAWRGLCAMAIAFFHAPFNTPLGDAPAFDNLQFCVDVFFVLSGFVLLHGYGARLAAAGGIRGFAIARFGRLWPLHATVLGLFALVEVARFVAARHGGGIGFVLPPFGPGRSMSEIADNLAMIQGIGPHGSLSWNFPAWSVAVEFWTSLVFAGIVFWCGPRRPLPFAILALASGLALHALSPSSPLVIERWGLLRCLCDFSVGCIAYQLRGRIGAFIAEMPRFGPSLLELGLTGLAIGFLVMVRPGPLGFVAPLLFGSFVLVFSFEQGAVSRLLRVPPLQALGRWSFSIYLLHVLVFEIVRSVAHLAEVRTGRTLLVAHGDGQLITTGSQGVDLALALAVLAFGVVPLACLSYRFVERPALAVFKAWARPRPPRFDAAPRLTVSRSLP